MENLGHNRKVVERATGNVFTVDFIVDSSTMEGFHMVVTSQYCERDIVCNDRSKVFRPHEVQFLEDMTQESWEDMASSIDH